MAPFPNRRHLLICFHCSRCCHKPVWRLIHKVHPILLHPLVCSPCSIWHLWRNRLWNDFPIVNERLHCIMQFAKCLVCVYICDLDVFLVLVKRFYVKLDLVFELNYLVKCLLPKLNWLSSFGHNPKRIVSPPVVLQVTFWWDLR